MDATLRTRAEELASEIAAQAKTAEDLNGLMQQMMKSALERMLDTEMDAHLGRRSRAAGEGDELDEISSTATLRIPADLQIVVTVVPKRRSRAIWVK